MRIFQNPTLSISLIDVLFPNELQTVLLKGDCFLSLQKAVDEKEHALKENRSVHGPIYIVCRLNESVY